MPAVIVEYCRDPKNPASVNDAGKIEYMVMAPLDELKLVQLDSTSEAFERLRLYVQEQLRVSSVIDEYHSNPVHPDSVAAHIVSIAWPVPGEYGPVRVGKLMVAVGYHPS